MDDKPALFRLCLAASLLLHGGLFLIARSSSRGVKRSLPPIEIDLTMPALGIGTGAPAKGTLMKAPPAPVPAQAPEVKPVEEVPTAQPPKEWVLPSAGQKLKTEPPSSSQPSPVAGGTPGSSAGTGTGGTPDGIGTGVGSGRPIQPPRLLNRDEMMLNLLRFYPESERRAGREGQVVLTLLIGADGSVEPGAVVKSAGADFDSAAREVAKLMRFAPAKDARGPVAVRLKQPIFFRLQD
ncbi:MAG: energy transducer TonB [Elusimicrobiota bacterium]|jgi:protein TonB